MGKTPGHSRGSRRRGTAVVIGCLAALLVATGAIASRGVTKNTNVAFPSDTQRTATASCPAKTHITGGGFQVSPGGTPGGTVNSFTTNSNFGGRKTWTVVSGQTSASTSGTLTSSARCERKRDGKIAVIMAGTRTITPDTTGPPYDATGLSIVFTCPPQTHPISGGYSVDKPYDPNVPATNKFFATLNRRTGTTWTVGGYLLGGPAATNPPAEFTAKVACESNGTRPVRQRSAVVPYNDDARATATATCRKRTHLVSGGFAFTPAGPGPIPVPFVDRNVPATNRAWTVSAYDSGFIGTPAGSTMTSYAYCRKNRPKRRRLARRSAAVAVAGSGSIEAVPLAPATVLAE